MSAIGIVRPIDRDRIEQYMAHQDPSRLSDPWSGEGVESAFYENALFWLVFVLIISICLNICCWNIAKFGDNSVSENVRGYVQGYKHS